MKSLFNKGFCLQQTRGVNMNDELLSRFIRTEREGGMCIVVDKEELQQVILALSAVDSYKENLDRFANKK